MKEWNPNSSFDIKVIDNLFQPQDLELLFELCSQSSPFFPVNYDSNLPSVSNFFIKPKFKSPLYPRSKYKEDIGSKSNVILELINNNILTSSFFNKKKIKILDAYINLSNTLDSDLAHVDNNSFPQTNTAYTLLLYANLEWDINWGGETLFYDKKWEEIVTAIKPKPGRIVLFDSTLYHSARPPQSHCPHNRYTIVLNLIIENE